MSTELPHRTSCTCNWCKAAAIAAEMDAITARLAAELDAIMDLLAADIAAGRLPGDGHG